VVAGLEFISISADNECGGVFNHPLQGVISRASMQASTLVNNFSQSLQGVGFTAFLQTVTVCRLLAESIFKEMAAKGLMACACNQCGDRVTKSNFEKDCSCRHPLPDGIMRETEGKKFPQVGLRADVTAWSPHYAGCQRGDHHRGASLEKDGCQGQTTVLDDQRECLRDEVEVRQSPWLPPSSSRGHVAFNLLL
jgi:hypothetical protein